MRRTYLSFLGRPGLLRASGSVFAVMLSVGMATAQINMIYQEGFNDDGDGTRYTMTGRGYNPNGSDGPGAWEHNFLVDVIGLPSTAPAPRAGILWSSEISDLDFTAASTTIWDNLISYMLGDKAGATIGFVPDILSPTADALSFRLEQAGHTVLDLGTILPDATGIDLVIHTDTGNVDPPTAFVNYAVPVITFNAPNHDDTAISSIGQATTAGPAKISIVAENAGHPVLGGLTGTVDWIDSFVADLPLQGIGGAYPGTATILATYVDPATEATLPAVILIDTGDPVLGAFAPTPEGAGYIVGGDLNLDLDGSGTVFSELDPRVVQLNPVDVSGATGVKLSVGLAATTVDFEAPDFLRVLYAEEGGDFVQLAQFDGMGGSLVDAALGALRPDAFTDYTFDIPDDINSLVVRIEGYSTFPNEVMGIDNIRIFTGEAVENPPLPGDIDGDGTVAFADFLVLSSNFGQAVAAGTGGDFDGNGSVDFADFLVLSANFGATAPVAAAVPEPAGLGLFLVGSLLLGGFRRRRS